MFPNVNSCNKLIDRKNLFVTKIPPLWECLSFSRGKFECCFIRSPHLEVFFNKIWSIHWKVFFQNSYSEYFHKILTKTLATGFIFRLAMSFQHVPCQGWFSRNFPKIFRAAFSRNAAGGTLLILCENFLKNFENTF